MSRSLSLSTGFVRDAFAVAPKIVYAPENIRLGEYTFLPWVRSGLAATVQSPAAGKVRATVAVQVTVQDDAGGSQVVEKVLTLRGPGDVLGIEGAQITQRYPKPGATDAEDTFLVHVEFDRPELPWLFTPFAPYGPNNGRLDPWMVLVVLDARRVRFEPSPPELPPRLRTRKGELQPLDESWSFAHAQVIGNATTGPSVSDRLSSQYGPANLSRLICPRRLEGDREYVACLVPAYDCGVKTGLGMGGGTLDKAWTRTANDEQEEIVLPVYDQWRFSTGPQGGFEELAKKLEPVRPPWNIGRRIIDTVRPRGGIEDLGADEPGRIQVLKCALFAPAPAPPGSPPEGGVWSDAKRGELRDEVNRPDEAAGRFGVPETDLPRVGPRIYARYQRGANTVEVDNDDWFHELNTNPAHRIVAGLGTRVVQKDQEPLMQAAWAQVGKIDKANSALVRLQYSRYIGAALHQQHFSKLTLGTLTQVTRGLQGKVPLGGLALTVAGAVDRSHVAAAALSGAFRRATRARGPITRRLTPDAAIALDSLVAREGTFRDFRRPVAEPDGIRGLSDAALKLVSPELAGRLLGVGAPAALSTLRQRLAPLKRDASVADRFLSPRQSWSVPDATIDIGKLGGERILRILQAALPARVSDDLVRSEVIGNMLNGIATSGVPDISARAKVVVQTIGQAMPPAVLKVAPEVPGKLVPGNIIIAPQRPPMFNPSPLRPGAFQQVIRQRGGEVLTRDRLQTETSNRIGAALAISRTVRTDMLANLLSETALGVGVTALPALADRQAPAVARSSLLAAIDPKVTVTRYALGRLGKFPAWLAPDWFADGQLQPIMAAPEFDRPMYEALDHYDRDWLVPGLGQIPKTDFVTLLETNPAFTESFLIGLSDELGRELLWRGYPTDQRGTYFQRFWDDHSDELSSPIHRFPRTPLGTHLTHAGAHIVLVVRGTLVKRYPHAIISALRATPGERPPKFFDPSQPGATARVLFHVHLSPDFILVGFDLTVAQVLAGGWWFVVSEHPTAPRFGLDAEDRLPPVAGQPEPRNAFDWDDVLRTPDGRFLRMSLPPGVSPFLIRESTADPAPRDVAWPPEHSAIVARTLLQNPFRAAFEGAKLITPALGGF